MRLCVCAQEKRRIRDEQCDDGGRKEMRIWGGYQGRVDCNVYQSSFVCNWRAASSGQDECNTNRSEPSCSPTPKSPTQCVSFPIYLSFSAQHDDKGGRPKWTVFIYSQQYYTNLHSVFHSSSLKPKDSEWSSSSSRSFPWPHTIGALCDVVGTLKGCFRRPSSYRMYWQVIW